MFTTRHPLPIPLPLCSSCLFQSNAVSTRLQGVGGALYLGRGNFSLEMSLLMDNSAYYGGALFVSADLGASTLMGYLNFTDNLATMGSAVFWCVGLWVSAGGGSQR